MEPGDYVECIRSPFAARFTCSPAWPAPGSIYVVRSIEPCDIGPCIKLVGIEATDNTGQEWAFNPIYFRPVYRPKAELIESLKVGEYA